MNYEHDSGGKVEFHPPKGVIPEDIAVGDTFDLVSTFRLKGNSEVCLVQMGEVKMPGYEEGQHDEEMEQHRKGYGDVAQSMMSSLGEGGGQGAQTGGGY